MRNSQAILDSLTRYEFAKLNIKQYKVDLSNNNKFVQQILGDNFRLTQKINAAAVQISNIETDRDDYKKRFKKANKERWIWRGGGAIGLALIVNKFCPFLPP